MTLDLARIGSSLRVRNYRLYFSGQLISVAGTWMQTLALAFLVLHLSPSGTALGLATAARFLPLLVFGPVGGVVADRFDKRRLLYLTQTLSALLAGLFAVLIATGVIRMWMVLVLSLALGCVTVFDNPTRQSMIAELVPRSEVSNAVTLNSVSINIARVLGAAVGGVVVAALGFATCFGLNALSFIAVLVTLAMMRLAEMYPAARAGREKGQLRAGLRYARSTPEIFIALIMIAVIGMLAWEFQVTLPLLAGTFHGGAGTYGLMASVMGAGAVVGGLITAYRGTPRRARGLAVAAIGWGVAILAAAAAPDLGLELVVLLFVGYGSISFNSLAKTVLQLASVPAMRGRVMALWALAWGGTTPIGGPLVGWIAEEFGARWSLVAGGLPTVLIALVAWPALRRIDQRTAAEPADYRSTHDREDREPVR